MAKNWQGSSKVRLHGARFAFSNGTVLLGMNRGVALMPLPEGLGSSQLSDTLVIPLDVNGIQEVAFSADGKWAAALEVGSSGPTRIFTIALEEGKDNLGMRLYGICRMWADSSGLMFSDDSQLVSAATFGYQPDDTRDVFKVLDSKRVVSQPSPGGPMVRTTVSPDGKLILERSPDKRQLSVWKGTNWLDLENGDAIIAQDFGFLTNRVVAATTGESICIWSTETGRIVGRISYSEGSTPKISITDKGPFLEN